MAWPAAPSRRTQQAINKLSQMLSTTYIAALPKPVTSPPPLQWLPVLLAFTAPHGENPTSPIEAAFTRANPSPAAHGPVSAIGTEAEGMRALAESVCIDADDGATNAYEYGGQGADCSWYTNQWVCNNLVHLDDSDFTAKTMCCECGGGRYESADSSGDPHLSLAHGGTAHEHVKSVPASCRHGLPSLSLTHTLARSRGSAQGRLRNAYYVVRPI